MNDLILPTKDQIFKWTYNILMILILITISITLIEYTRNGTTEKMFFYLGYSIFLKLSQINTIMYMKMI